MCIGTEICRQTLLGRSQALRDSSELEAALDASLGKTGCNEVVAKGSSKGRFAIKSMYIDEDENFDLGRELEILSLADHPHLVQMHSSYLWSEDPENDEPAAHGKRMLHVVMDMAEGGNLEDLVMQTGPLLEEEASRMLSQVAEALVFLHTKLNCIHRDIKPANVLCGITEPRHWVLCDYGWAHIRPYGRVTRQMRATANAGTPGWQAPEVQGEAGTSLEYSSQCDIYSLGLVLFYALQDQFYSDKDDLVSQWTNREVSQGMQRLVSCMLNEEPEFRPSAVDLVEFVWSECNEISDAEGLLLSTSDTHVLGHSSVKRT